MDKLAWKSEHIIINEKLIDPSVNAQSMRQIIIENPIPGGLQ